ncbi:DNA polymerase II [Candidatus Pacearchaeota archaeon]|nr:DNA polymerase II [Candidatus Pacearchaeota archaeon]
MKAYIVYPTHTTIENQTYIQLFGRLENNQSFVSLNKFSPYFFIKTKDKKIINKYLKNYTVEETKLKTFQDEPLLKISAENSTELNKLYKAIRKTLPTFEADLKPHQQFLIEKNILGTVDIEGEYETAEKIDRVYSNPKLTPADYKPNLKIASIDIESDKTLNTLFCIGIHSDNFNKTFMVTTNQNLKDVIPCKTEAEALEKFKAQIIKLDPDIITGWNVIDFDFAYLKSLFEKNNLSFDIGRTNQEPRLRLESSFFRSSSVSVPGRQVLDALNLIRDPFVANSPQMKNIKFETYTLEDVAQAILKRGKILKGPGRHKEIENLYKTNQQKLADYNLLDCELPYEILEKNKIIDLAIERSQLTGLPLDRISGSISAFDSLYIREAHKKGFASPTLVYQKKEERIKGGYVSSLKPGIYKNVLILDFKSLYPSIIKTFNIDPASFQEHCEKDSVKAPNNACFKNREGILPEIIHTLHQAREKAKKEKRELSSYAIKIIMNSFFGVLASPNCRYFNLDIANAITHFGQQIIKLTAEEIEKKFKTKVIYSDTDSVFVNTSLEKTKANFLGKEIQEYINQFYQNYVKKNYARHSYLELEFEKQYLALMIPKLRGKETAAAKKRYAGLKEVNGKEELEIVGLEAIRGDWTDAAQEFQKELLNKIFHDQPIEPYIKSYVTRIKEGKLDDKLVYRKSIRKSLEQYTKTTPPHVKAARLLPNLESSIIEYVVTVKGPQPIQLQKNKIDYEHYIEKQIKPIANQILLLFDKDFDEIIQTSKQTKLF